MQKELRSQPRVLSLPDDTLETVLEPFNSLVTLDLVGGSNVGLASATLSNTLTRAGPTTSLVFRSSPSMFE